MDKLLSGLVVLQAAGGSSMSMVSTIVTFGLVFVIFYFLIIRPQNKKQKEAKAMVAAMKKGDKVVTIGGIHGVITSVKETTVIIKVDDNTKLEFSKSAVQAVTAKGSEDKSEDKNDLDKPAEEKK
ncbi:MAG TPA: preprotein translocase subunit YajC [Rectinemataceae bacterium]|nr:preprotein translocase subunit YajC [Rectinemataceae bacterium]